MRINMLNGVPLNKCRLCRKYPFYHKYENCTVELSCGHICVLRTHLHKDEEKIAEDWNKVVEQQEEEK